MEEKDRLTRQLQQIKDEKTDLEEHEVNCNNKRPYGLLLYNTPCRISYMHSIWQKKMEEARATTDMELDKIKTERDALKEDIKTDHVSFNTNY